ncbi:MAG: phosphatidylserine decarboxylase [Gammaproteobacteria bacterium RIFCSPHIGHO2_12_FULL_41_20]|nr:MAG: phosphatidylserine decarboxylase [Gammaproteobacteria bacterium RIFCSPHIGHO2_12_FULL_41_20]
MAKFLVLLQYLLPQHLLTQFVGWLAECRWPWIKNTFIQWAIRHYRIDLTNALIENPRDYATFNGFFTRQLKPTTRPIIKNPHHILSPIDGYATQAAYAKQNQLLQAKNKYFSLETLCGDQVLAKQFHQGAYAVLYLAPHNYHRVHMPMDGQLTQSIFIPGKLFSVNHMTSNRIPNLYARNERLVTYFDTAHGPMAIILVGALIVGSIQTVWQPCFRSTTLQRYPVPDKPAVTLQQGEELGLFKMGSTVILLFSQDAHLSWSIPLHTELQMGQVIGQL